MRFRFLYILLCFSACADLTPEARFCEERRKITHSVLREFTKEMRAKGFYAKGIGEAIDHNNAKQKELEVVFGVDYLPDIQYSRQLLIKTIEQFLIYINSKEGIENYLTVYPFNIKFISVTFINQSDDGLSIVSNYGEVLHYYKRNPEKPNGLSIEIHCESFDEAVRILAVQQTKALSTCSI